MCRYADHTHSSSNPQDNVVDGDELYHSSDDSESVEEEEEEEEEQRNRQEHSEEDHVSLISKQHYGFLVYGLCLFRAHQRRRSKARTGGASRGKPGHTGEAGELGDEGEGGVDMGGVGGGEVEEGGVGEGGVQATVSTDLSSSTERKAGQLQPLIGTTKRPKPRETLKPQGVGALFLTP